MKIIHMKAIHYKHKDDKRYGELVTPCPYLEDAGLQIMVASRLCQECIYFKGKDKINQIVYCRKE